MQVYFICLWIQQPCKFFPWLKWDIKAKHFPSTQLPVCTENNASHQFTLRLLSAHPFHRSYLSPLVFLCMQMAARRMTELSPAFTSNHLGCIETPSTQFRQRGDYTVNPIHLLKQSPSNHYWTWFLQITQFSQVFRLNEPDSICSHMYTLELPLRSTERKLVWKNIGERERSGKDVHT